MLKVSKKKAVYAMSRDNQPVAEVGPGVSFLVETEDCYSGRLASPRDKFTRDMWATVNPATGPILISGAEPGDTLAVEIEEIRTRDYAVMCLEAGSSPLGKFIQGLETTIMPIRDGRLEISPGFSAAICPMIGVIGTAPAGEAVLNGTPGEHGGNMDCRLATAGAVIHLPVAVPGALLAIGDLHALMGDGEVCICGAEVSGEARLRVRIEKKGLPTPCIKSGGYFHFIGSALSLDECEGIVIEKAHRFLADTMGMAPNEAARTMSLLGHLAVCQVVDPLKTMRFSLPDPEETSL